MISETSGNFKKLAISLLQGNRDENETVDKELAKEDASVSKIFKYFFKYLKNISKKYLNIF